MCASADVLAQKAWDALVDAVGIELSLRISSRRLRTLKAFTAPACGLHGADQSTLSATQAFYPPQADAAAPLDDLTNGRFQTAAPTATLSRLTLF